MISSGGKVLKQGLEIPCRTVCLWSICSLEGMPSSPLLSAVSMERETPPTLPCSDSSQPPPAGRSAMLSAGALPASIGRFPGAIWICSAQGVLGRKRGGDNHEQEPAILLLLSFALKRNSQKAVCWQVLASFV